MVRRPSYVMGLVLLVALLANGLAFGDTWEGRVETSPDAVEDQLSRGMYSTSSDLELPYDGGDQVIGLRFRGVIVPKGATIDRAYLEFTVDEVQADLPANLIIDGELSADPAPFGAAGYDVDKRERTNAKVHWYPEHYPTVGEQHQSADISSVIEEIVNLSNWATGGDLVIIIYNDPDNPSLGYRTVETGGAGDLAPLLHVEWSLGNAGSPNPADGETEVSRDTDLSWSAGVFAEASNGQTLYFSDNFDDVDNGIGGITQTATTYDPGRLEFGTMYYWRVRQNNASSQPANEGRVWHFTTEYFSYPIVAGNITATASSADQDGFGPENTINGSGLDDMDQHSTASSDMWLSGTEASGAWIQYEFDKVYKVYEMQVWNYNVEFEAVLGYGLKNVTVEYSENGTDWTVLGDVEFAQGTAAMDYAPNSVVDFGGVSVKYVRLTASNNWGGLLPQYGLSEVRFMYIPVNASDPVPASGTTAVDLDAVLSWRAGREAAMHEVYVSTDEQAVIDGTAPIDVITEASYSPANLDLETTYYWKVSEVNEAEVPSAWDSNVWSFTTNDHIMVDDFETYNGEANHEVYMTWADGFESNTNGAQVGHLMSPFTETAIVHGGRQSMPLFYSNTGSATYSEGERTFAVAQDWTRAGVATLVVWFHGQAGNTGQMYLKINGTQIPYDGAETDIALEAWQAWSVDLASSGLNLKSITTLTIGVSGNGAQGTLYFDDIALQPSAPEPVYDWRITDDMDDVEEAVSTGSMDVGSSDVEMPYEGEGQDNMQLVGLRFPGTAIPQGATITEAWVRFQVDEDKGGADPVNLIVEGELSPNADPFSSSPLNISGRTATAAQVKWSVPQWINVGDQGPDQTTPSLVTIIQEIVNQADWSGGAIVLMFRDDPDNPSVGVRCAEAGPGNDAALLHINYE